jgi:hypothetical protein
VGFLYLAGSDVNYLLTNGIVYDTMNPDRQKGEQIAVEGKVLYDVQKAEVIREGET